MSSIELSAQNLATINRLVLEVRRFGPTRDILRETAAAKTAGSRLMRGPLTEAELRAVIYDAVFNHAVEEMNNRSHLGTERLS